MDYLQQEELSVRTHQTQVRGRQNRNEAGLWSSEDAEIQRLHRETRAWWRRLLVGTYPVYQRPQRRAIKWLDRLSGLHCTSHFLFVGTRGLVHTNEGTSYPWGSPIAQPGHDALRKTEHTQGSFPFLSGNNITPPRTTIARSGKQLIRLKLRNLPYNILHPTCLQTCALEAAEY